MGISPSARLGERIRRREPLVGAAIGSGMAAAAAESGGADFLIILSAGIFRTRGCSSMAALMPYANANQTTLHAAEREVLPRVGSVPAFVGLCAQDPGLNPGPMFARLRELGIVGVTNFPSVGFVDGVFREGIEEAGMGFDREVELLAAAREAGLLTVGFCFNAAEAVALTRAGIDILNLDLGFAEWRDVDPEKHQDDLDGAVRLVTEVGRAVEAVCRDAYLMVYGGPLLLPQDTALIYQRTRARGYIGGSTIERFPAAPLIRQTVRSFKRTASRDWREGRLGALIGSTPAMHALFEQVELVAQSPAPVLITGESGTGKELVAREIHRLSPRAGRPMVSVNCAAISTSLAMSELFGHERGAFTGAAGTHHGKFEQANGTTLFMDEVGELPADVQASLLRVLQEREIVRVGGSRALPVDVRLVAATNRPLQEMVPEKSFRLDLYFRLSVVVLHLPALRERREDIPRLVMELAHELSRRYGVPVPAIPEDVMRALVEHSWPGNVRELRNAVERCLILGRGGAFRLEWLQDLFAMAGALQAGGGAPAGERVRGRERLGELLRRHGGNKSAVARELGVTRKTIYEWLKAPGAAG